MGRIKIGIDGLTGSVNPGVEGNQLVPSSIINSGHGGISNKQGQDGNDEQDEHADVEKAPPRKRAFCGGPDVKGTLGWGTSADLCELFGNDGLGIVKPVNLVVFVEGFVDIWVVDVGYETGALAFEIGVL